MQVPHTNDPYERGGAGASRSVLPESLRPKAAWLRGASKEEIVAEARRVTPDSPCMEVTIGNLMVARALALAEARSGRNLSDAQQESL